MMTGTAYEPRDRTRREHIARVSVGWVNDTNDFAFLRAADGATITVNVADPHSVFDPSTTYRFMGRWCDSPDRGPRFAATTWVVHQVHGRRGVVRYLCELCDGIGEKSAGKIYDKYGPDCVSALRESPAAVAEASGVHLETCEHAARQLKDHVRHEATKIDLFELFTGRGFQTGPLIKACISRWGAKAPAVVRHNPFALLGMPSAGFKRCDAMWLQFGKPLDAMKRQVLCAADACKNDGNGHTWLKGTDLAERLKKLVPTADAPEAFRIAKRARLLKFRRDDRGDVWAAVYARGAAEERIAARVKVLNAHPSLWPTSSLLVSQTDEDRLPSLHQVERLTLATTGPLGILIGGPGTGKSFVTSFLLREIINRFGKDCVAACSPTGKAAQRMNELLIAAGIDIKATTIHRLLKIGRNGHDGDGWGFEFNDKTPLTKKFILMDEVSMTGSTLMADFLDACAPGTHVLLIGDSHQLPPVEHGAPLRDMLEAGIPHGELTEVRRNAGQIVHACARIKAGEPFETADKIDLVAAPPRNLKLIEPRDDAHATELLTQVLGLLPRYGFDPVWGTQVICARNVVRKALNALLHPLCNPDGQAGGPRNPFRVGDKIICLRNSKMHRVVPLGAFPEATAGALLQQAANYQVVMKVPDDSPDDAAWRQLEDPDDARARKAKAAEPEEVYVANGEIGRVVAVGPHLAIARFGDEGSGAASLVKIPIGRQGEKEQEDAEGEPDGDEGGEAGKGCQFDLAYSITVHRGQGSEWPCVIVMADASGGGIADRSWWYTAISRASKLCIVIGKREVLDKQRARRGLVRRKTFLVEQLKEVLRG